MALSFDFMFRKNFPGLSDETIEGFVPVVEAQWTGALNDFWGGMNAVARDQNRLTFKNLVLAWYLANMFPGEVVDAIANGALPLTGKSSGGLSLQYMGLETVQDGLKPLMSNQWGMSALSMLMSAPERFVVQG